MHIFFSCVIEPMMIYQTFITVIKNLLNPLRHLVLRPIGLRWKKPVLWCMRRDSYLSCWCGPLARLYIESHVATAHSLIFCYSHMFTIFHVWATNNCEKPTCVFSCISCWYLRVKNDETVVCWKRNTTLKVLKHEEIDFFALVMFSKLGFYKSKITYKTY